jgi:ubiquinol-cytochrome c reductase subunit 6
MDINLTYLTSPIQDEIVDPFPEIRKECVKTCPKPALLYDACAQRIKEKGEGDCELWYFDLLHCVDKCAAPKIFKLTK